MNIFLSLLISYFAFNIELHDIHVSMCDIKYDTESSALQISVRIFLDDLETSLANDGYQDLKILTKKEAAIADSLILNYLNKHLRLTLDNQPLHLEYLGKELSEDFQAMWSYLEVHELTNPEKLTVNNDILMELYNDQQNIISVKKDSKRKGHFIFSKGHTSESIEL